MKKKFKVKIAKEYLKIMFNTMKLLNVSQTYLLNQYIKFHKAI